MSEMHPLEPLSAAEVEHAVALLRTLAEFTPATRVISVMLKEPPKDLVHGWPNIETPDRYAEAVCTTPLATPASTWERILPLDASLRRGMRPRARSPRCRSTSRWSANRPFSRATSSV
jgi:Cu2+-containing amine oxidase